MKIFNRILLPVVLLLCVLLPLSSYFHKFPRLVLDVSFIVSYLCGIIVMIQVFNYPKYGEDVNPLHSWGIVGYILVLFVGVSTWGVIFKPSFCYTWELFLSGLIPISGPFLGIHLGMFGRDLKNKPRLKYK